MKKNAIKWIIVLAVIGLLVYVNNEYVHLNPGMIREWILSFGLFAPVVYIALYTIRPLVLFPASILSLAAGLAFGAWWGTVYTVVGATLGAIVSFALSRKVGTGLIKKKTSGPKMMKIREQMEARGFLYVLLLRLVPLFNFDLISYAAGISNVRFVHFVVGTFIGIIPGTFAYNYLGSSIVGNNLWVIVTAVLVFIIITVIPLTVSSKLREKLGLKKTGGKVDA